MAKTKKPTEKKLLKMGVFKGYVISWLRKQEDHPDLHLVAEFDALVAPKEEPKAEEPVEEVKEPKKSN